MSDSAWTRYLLSCASTFRLGRGVWLYILTTTLVIAEVLMKPDGLVTVTSRAETMTGQSRITYVCLALGIEIIVCNV